MKRPKIDIQIESIDKVVEGCCIIGLLGLILIPVFYYNFLPELIPTHFGVDGKADAFGSRQVIWALPVIGIASYLAMTLINRYPHKFNYIQKITDQNAPRIYKRASRLVRFLKLIVLLIFNYISISMIRIALEQQGGLSGYFIPAMFLTIAGTTWYFLFKPR